MAEFMSFQALGLAEVGRRGGTERQAPWQLQVDHRDVPQKLRDGVAVPDYSVTSSMHDRLASETMKVKSGYEGHVPQGRDFVGGSYRTLANRGVPGTEPYAGARTRLPANFHQPVLRQPTPDETALAMHDKFSKRSVDSRATGAGDGQHEYGIPTTAKVPARVQKILTGDTRNFESRYMKSEEQPWLMTGYSGHVCIQTHHPPLLVSLTLAVCACRCQAPKSREVIGASYRGPAEGPAFHGTAMPPGRYHPPSATNRCAIAP